MPCALLALPVTLLALLACAAVAAPAPAAVKWVVRGHGFGHGVGMSAYGAYGYAKHGAGYKEILSHYYPGTELSTLSEPRVVRVLLGVASGEVRFSGARGACGVELDPRRTYEAHRRGGSVRLRTAAGKPLADCGRKLRAAGAGRVRIAGYGPYRGALEAAPSGPGNTLNVVNAVAVDQYVKGVIPNESPPSWPFAALEAQAVASRSFALAGGRNGNGFDLYADTRSQVYKGLASEYERTNRAAAATRGQVLTYGGEVAETMFSACSGGRTESSANVFGGAIPYLVGVPDPYDHYCPLHRWQLEFSGPQISAKLGGLLAGRLKRVVITKTGFSPRIIEAKLIGTRGVTSASGAQLQAALGAYSTWMTFQKVVTGGRR